jgi:hypothetical protein
MAYSDSMHFSDKLSYKILCFSSYGLKDMKNTRFTNLQEFQKIEERRKKTTRAESGADLRRRIVSVARGDELLRADLGRGPAGAPDVKNKQKVELI